jgi:hypothetical protein
MRSLLVYTITVGFVSTAIAVSAQSSAARQGEQDAAQGGNIAHGQYIAEHVAMCIECHSPRDQNGRIIEGREFMGAVLPIDPPAGWASRAPRNRGLLGYSDAQAMRLLTQGAIGRHNEQLMLPMPRFRMTTRDAADVIAFLRSLP